MPTAGRQQSSTLDHATRQQLDELDALMQRMLALPVNPPEDFPNPPRQQPPTETTSETACASADPSPAADGGASPPVPEPSSPIPAVQTEVQDAAASTEARPRSSPATLVPLTASLEALERWGDSSRTRLAPVSSVFAGLDAPREVKARSVRSTGTPEGKAYALRVAWPLRPLLGLNLAFDWSTAWLGPLGRWLRGPGGRALLGWGSLLLLAAALAWVALDGMGWTW